MKTDARSLRLVSLLTLFAVSLLQTPMNAWGDHTFDVVHSMNFQTIPVIGNGTQYTKVPGVAFGWQTRFEAGVKDGWAGRVKNWEVTPDIYSVDSDGSRGKLVKQFIDHAVSKSYPVGDRPKHVNRTVGGSLSSADVQKFAVNLCNARANMLRQNGDSNFKIFSQDHEIKLLAVATLEAYFTYWTLKHSGRSTEIGPGAINQKITPNTKIICQKWAGAQIETSDAFKVDDSVKHAALLTIEQYGPSGMCQVQLSGMLETTMANTQAKFRYKDNTGKQSDIKTVTTDHTHKAFFSHRYKIPFNPDGDEGGSIRIVSATGSPLSAPSEYNMRCTEAATDKLATDLPPELHLNVNTLGTVMVDGQICPKNIKFRASVKARSDLVGSQLMFVGRPHYFSKLHPVDQQTGETEYYGDQLVLKWPSKGSMGLTTKTTGPAAPLKSQSFKFATNLINKEGNNIGSVPFAPFKVQCRRQGFAPNPVQPKPAFPAVGPLVAKPKPNTQSTNGKGPATLGKRTNGASRKRRQSSTIKTASLKPPKKIDAAATGLIMNLTPNGVAVGKVQNKGDAGAKVRYTLEVKTKDGKVAGKKTGTLRLRSGEQQSVSANFQTRPRGYYKATLEVKIDKDSNSGNNRRQVSATRTR